MWEFSLNSSALNIANRKKGLSGFMRLKNEATFLEQAIKSHVPYLDELVIVDNNSTDETAIICKKLQQEYPEKIKYYLYKPYVYPIGTKECFNLPIDHPQSIANYYNYALVQTTYKTVVKIDGDHIAIPEQFEQSCNVARTLKDDEWLSIYGLNLYEKDNYVYVANFYNYHPFPIGTIRRGSAPFTHGDHAFFNVSEYTWHNIHPQHGYEIMYLSKLKLQHVRYLPISFLHLKGIKKDKGMGNWGLKKYKNSIRNEWAKSIENIDFSNLMSISMCKKIFPDYFGDSDLEALLSSVINIKVAEQKPYEKHMYKKRKDKSKNSINKLKREVKRIFDKI